MGGKGSGRKATKPKDPKRTRAELVPCAWCKKMMYAGKHGANKKYCSLSCKQHAYRARRAKVQA